MSYQRVPRASLMGLPCEVREMILGELLTLRQVDKSQGRKCTCDSCVRGPGSAFPQVLSTCRQLQAEGAHVFDRVKPQVSFTGALTKVQHDSLLSWGVPFSFVGQGRETDRPTVDYRLVNPPDIEAADQHFKLSCYLPDLEKMTMFDSSFVYFHGHDSADPLRHYTINVKIDLPDAERVYTHLIFPSLNGRIRVLQLRSDTDKSVAETLKAELDDKTHSHAFRATGFNPYPLLRKWSHIVEQLHSVAQGKGSIDLHRVTYLASHEIREALAIMTPISEPAEEQCVREATTLGLRMHFLSAVCYLRQPIAAREALVQATMLEKELFDIDIPPIPRDEANVCKIANMVNTVEAMAWMADTNRLMEGHLDFLILRVAPATAYDRRDSRAYQRQSRGNLDALRLNFLANAFGDQLDNKSLEEHWKANPEIRARFIRQLRREIFEPMTAAKYPNVDMTPYQLPVLE